MGSLRAYLLVIDDTLAQGRAKFGSGIETTSYYWEYCDRYYYTCFSV